MATFNILLLLGAMVLGIIASRANHLIGGYRLLSWMKSQIDSFSVRGRTTTSEKEKKAIRETLMVCGQLQKTDLTKWNFKFETLLLLEKIASIYHPNVPVPMEQARLGDVLKVLQEANQKVLHIIRLPRIDYITRFRVIQVVESFHASSGDQKILRQRSSGLQNLLLGPLYRKLQTWVVRSLLVQWLLLLGDAAIEVYGDNSIDGEVEAEAILSEWENFKEEPDVPLSENIKQIVESSKKEILFSATSISWKKAGQIYFALANQIARHYHSDSVFPIYEVRVCDILKSVSDSLESIGRLGQKPVLNKILNIRISRLNQAKDLTLPFGENKILEWVNRYQVGRIAKWSHTLYRTLQKKQPGILLRDVVFGVVKEGGKRWLVLYLHGKIAAEANKLYGR